VEESTAITSCIDRFMELLKLDSGVAKKMVIVAPHRRRRKLDSVLTSSHYIGHPLYMENKLAYLFYDDIVKLYTAFIDSKPTTEILVSKLASSLQFPVIGR